MKSIDYACLDSPEKFHLSQIMLMKRVCDYKMYICAHVGWVLLYHGDIQTNKIAATHFKILELRVKYLVVCRLTHSNVFTLD